MVLDLDLFRVDKGGDPERVRSNVKARFADTHAVESVIQIDGEWRKRRHCLDQLNKAKNQISKEYGNKMKQLRAAGEQASDTGDEPASPGEPLNLSSLLEKINDISKDVTLAELKGLRQQVEDQIIAINKELEEFENKRSEILREIGNLLHPDVPISDNEDENAIIRTWGDLELGKTGDNKFLSHVDLISMIGGIDSERGAAIAGSRGYFLLGPAVWLQQALIQYALRFIADLGFDVVYTPFWMRKSLMSQVAQLSQFDDELYKVISSKDSEDAEEKYLIATAEQPIAALHRNEWINPSNLPIKYGGLSTCFRQEVGAHGRDTRGIFRVHQFEKVEQFIIAAPSKSWDYFHEMIQNSEKFYQSLGIPYRVVSIVSGALNNAAAMKYDLEAWFPGSAAFRELVSVSNCTDYQSRRLQIRYGQTKKMTGQVEYVHMLNGTMCAISRAICVILEVHQTPEGIRVPQPLQQFMPEKYKELIPFTNKS
ncbi:serine-tRNA ligase: cytoplasmic-like protein [Leptotrombidium deliense]|uniref:serine--tRNA ligase n=1 Tax=Leptotrombidium deliense TaxID=299467 RepID=A0A443STX6_9ACAR|nr:serine-tRNA ligase: cytoplasmic-like protein [Leptotrombidium deliense]